MAPIPVKILREGAKLPTYGTAEAAGADLYACLTEAVTIAPGETVFIPTGIAMEVPAGCAGLVYAHSGLDKATALGAEAVAGGNMTAFELACDNAVNSYLGKAKLVSFGSEPLTAYLAALENEVTAARMILTGRLAGIRPDALRERLRDLYA